MFSFQVLVLFVFPALTIVNSSNCCFFKSANDINFDGSCSGTRSISVYVLSPQLEIHFRLSSSAKQSSKLKLEIGGCSFDLIVDDKTKFEGQQVNVAAVRPEGIDFDDLNFTAVATKNCAVDFVAAMHETSRLYITITNSHSVADLSILFEEASFNLQYDQLKQIDPPLKAMSDEQMAKYLNELREQEEQKETAPVGMTTIHGLLIGSFVVYMIVFVHLLEPDMNAIGIGDVEEDFQPSIQLHPGFVSFNEFVNKQIS
ncbi:hypothetical protein M3Y96_01240000 [Aphelenchoides besseyi]|nr:hypothetical protein M3Y96_01240000 [Aphelenchoides besseyi]